MKLTNESLDNIQLNLVCWPSNAKKGPVVFDPKVCGWDRYELSFFEWLAAPKVEEPKDLRSRAKG